MYFPFQSDLTIEKYNDIVSTGEDTYSGQGRVINYSSSGEFNYFRWEGKTFIVLSETSFSRDGTVYDRVDTP